DTFGRFVANGLSGELGQSIVVENKPGAGGNIGADMVAKSKADGYTLLLAQDSLSIVPYLYRDLPFNVFKDFKSISIGVYMPMVLIASNKVPAQNMAELLALAKQDPGKLSYGSPGIGTAHHLNFESLLRKTGTQMMHVPYKGSSLMMTDIVSGNVNVGFSAISTALGLIESGKVKVLAVAASERSPILPNVPTLGETVLGYTANVWFGLSAPAGTPDQVTQRLAQAMRSYLDKPDSRTQLERLGYRVDVSTPSGMDTIMRDEHAKWGELLKTVTITN
ncbi:MAG TPA: tripartite tricarboxylate transporter substrate binding protein, partial [Pusillimonas sp.]